MTDYIKREDALRTFNNAFYSGLVAKINEIPSADVAEVVRCKDCFLYGGCQAAKFYGDDGYCSVGERGDDESVDS